MNFPQITNKQFVHINPINPWIETQDSNGINYHKLLKMKKMLIDTQKKMFNRIKLFQKASQKVLKKKENQLKVHQKIQQIKNNPIFSRTRPKSRDNIACRSHSRLAVKSHINNTNCRNYASPQHLNFDKQNLIQPSNFILERQKQKMPHFYAGLLKNSFRQSQHFERQEPPSTSPNRKNILGQRLNQARFQNAKIMKQDRQRNKIIIQQRKKKQLTRKLQSANIIRRQRQKAKIVKQQCFKQKHQDWRRFMDEKYQKEKQQFIKLQDHLVQLQQKEKQALITWKKTVDN